MRKINQKGFTIIELLVVIVIIGILVALTLPNLFSAQARGRDSERKNEIGNLKKDLESFFNDNDQYPADQAALSSDDPAVGIGAGTDQLTGPRGDTYEYECTNTSNGCQSYTLSIALENENDKDATAGVYTVSGVNQ